jgi:hypothetical protein
MKKTVLSLIALIALTTGASFAQSKHKQAVKAPATTEHVQPAAAPAASQTPPQPDAATTLKPENIAFTSDKYEFGTVSEGLAAEHVFTFTNTGKEPLIIQRVQPSCGCTTPDWTKEPIQPGQTGMIKASYGTQGRPGRFDKTMTVFSNAGTRTISFGGTVEKAPESSVPQNGSVMRN